MNVKTLHFNKRQQKPTLSSKTPSKLFLKMEQHNSKAEDGKAQSNEFLGQFDNKAVS